LELRSSAANGLFDEAVLARLQSHPQVASASPVLESSSYALDGAAPTQDAAPAQTAQRIHQEPVAPFLM
jgi:hypothetical protein